MKTVTRAFLESKVDYKFYSHDGNAYKLSDFIYKFTQYNFLSGGDENGLDGHYSFIVDILNFNYVVYKCADYGGLTWVKDVANKVFINIHESIKAMVESLIAQKVLRTYHFDSKDVCNRGEFLIPKLTDEYEFLGKRHLISDWVDTYPDDLGKLTDIEKLAVATLKDRRELTLKLF